MLFLPKALDHQIVFIVGPTAVGKSALALQLAEPEDVIVNCDSIQCYQGLSIGSSLPSAEAFAQRSHQLYAYVPKGGLITAGEYRRDFFSLIDSYKVAKRFFVVGGTGFYFLALENGMFEAPVNLELKKQLEERAIVAEGRYELYLELQNLDPQVAANISPQDTYRITRALTIIKTSGKTLTQVKHDFAMSAENKFPYRLLKIGVSDAREILFARVQKRTENMLESGLLDEVLNLVDEGFENWTPLRSVGYKETLEFIRASRSPQNNKAISKDELFESINGSTMKLIKKQKTWFQRDKEIKWFRSEVSINELEVIRKLLGKFASGVSS